MRTGVSVLPDFSKDATDRNRTSPLAFTGNKFEFRMVGSRDSVASPNVVLNTIVAEAFSDACDILEKAADFDAAVHELISEYATGHQRIVFDGNGYSEEWVQEAKRRGLPNIRTSVESYQYLVTEDTVNMFEKFHVFTRAELESRAEIKYENYAKVINIEARAMIDIASKHIIPVVIRYISALARSINQVKRACAYASVDVQEELLLETSDLLVITKNSLKTLEKLMTQVSEKKKGKEQAYFFMEEVVPAMEALRRPIDKLEMIVDKSLWPMPSYGDLLFEV